MNKKTITYGDRIFARLTMGGKTVIEFMMNRVSSVAELIAEMRRSLGSIRGLATLSIRNQSRGWSEERALLFRA